MLDRKKGKLEDIYLNPKETHFYSQFMGILFQLFSLSSKVSNGFFHISIPKERK
jgi:hypothetical protein